MDTRAPRSPQPRPVLVLAGTDDLKLMGGAPQVAQDFQITVGTLQEGNLVTAVGGLHQQAQQIQHSLFELHTQGETAAAREVIQARDQPLQQLVAALHHRGGCDAGLGSFWVWHLGVDSDFAELRRRAGAHLPLQNTGKRVKEAKVKGQRSWARRRPVMTPRLAESSL